MGRMALYKYADRVDCIIDNNKTLYGHSIRGIAIKSVEEGIKDIGDKTVVVAGKCQDSMAEQLRKLGVDKYILFLGESKAYYGTEELVVNPYLDNRVRDISEEEWNKNVQRDFEIETVNRMVEKMQGKAVMFDHVEIETVNRCNGNCEFCPVNRKNDTREYKLMADELFQNIIDQLEEINYDGRLALFSNNEPFLDPNILQRHKYARMKLPKARMHLFTNGTLLTVERFQELMLYLDELIIDNYQQDLKLIKPCREIANYCEKHPELKKKVTIVLRKPQEILTTRGGDAPNRKVLQSYPDARCVLPYKQLIIRPDGKVSLCCNDPLGKNTLGDLKQDAILDVWNNDRFKVVRKCLYEGRGHWEHCKYCDFFGVG